MVGDPLLGWIMLDVQKNITSTFQQTLLDDLLSNHKDF